MSVIGDLFADKGPFPLSVEKQLCTVIIREYCLHSYAYYIKDTNIIPDSEYDELCLYMKEHFTTIKKHDISGYINYEELKAGSGYVTAHKITGQTLDYILERLKR